MFVDLTQDAEQGKNERESHQPGGLLAARDLWIFSALHTAYENGI